MPVISSVPGTGAGGRWCLCPKGIFSSKMLLWIPQSSSQGGVSWQFLGGAVFYESSQPLACEGSLEVDTLSPF